MQDPDPATPPPLPPSSQPPPVPAPAAPPPVPVPAPAATEKIVAVFKGVDWKQLGRDFKTFGQRFASSDFAHITPEPHEMTAVAGHTPRMAALIVWRRALLMMACVLGTILVIKTCFDPHTLGSQMEKASLEAQKKANPSATAEQIKEAEKAVKEDTAETIKSLGESNVSILNTILVGLWLSLIGSVIVQFFAAKSWRHWRGSRKLALIAAGVLLLPQLLAMFIPWSRMMDFGHLEGAAGNPAQAAGMKLGIQLMVLVVVLSSALPLLYGLFNGVLRASLAAKTLVPASIVCGWGTLLLAITISVPWFVVLSIVQQVQGDALLVMGILCLLAAPLSIVFKARRLGLPLTSDEASPLVKRARFLFTGLNVGGVVLVLYKLSESNLVSTSEVITMVLHYLANLMLVSVVAVDLLALLLNRAHLKLAADTAPSESLRQLSEVLPPH